MKKTLVLFSTLLCMLASLAQAQSQTQWCILTIAPEQPYYPLVEQIMKGIKNINDSWPMSDTKKPLPQTCFAPFETGLLVLGPVKNQAPLKQLGPSQPIALVAGSDLGRHTPALDFKYIPAPREMMSKITTIEKTITSVHLLVSQDHNSHLLKYTQKAFEEIGIKLVLHPLSEPKLAAKNLVHIINNLEKSNEILWISQHHVNFNLNPLIPLIVKQTLRKEKMAMSNNLAWIDKGIYIGVFPDNELYGEQIAKKIVEHSFQTSNAELKVTTYYIEALKLAINRKTSRFLNKKIKRSQAKKIDLLLPQD